MARLIVNQGLQVELDRLFAINGPPAAVQSMAVDDATEAFQAADTKLNDGTGYTQHVAQAFDSAATRASQTVSATTTYGTGTANFTIRRISLHYAASGSVTASSTTLFGGIDGQSLTKTTDFSLAITLQVTATSV